MPTPNPGSQVVMLVQFRGPETTAPGSRNYRRVEGAGERCAAGAPLPACRRQSNFGGRCNSGGWTRVPARRQARIRCLFGSRTFCGVSLHAQDTPAQLKTTSGGWDSLVIAARCPTGARHIQG